MGVGRGAGGGEQQRCCGGWLASHLLPDREVQQACLRSSMRHALCLCRAVLLPGLGAAWPMQTRSSAPVSIAVQNVHFNYPARPALRVLSGLSLTVHPGEIVALVGPSGGGKSSIVKLVERFYMPSEGGARCAVLRCAAAWPSQWEVQTRHPCVHTTSPLEGGRCSSQQHPVQPPSCPLFPLGVHPAAGRVLIDNRDVGEYSAKWLKRHVALVSQEPVLYARSIRRRVAALRYAALCCHAVPRCIVVAQLLGLRQACGAC